MKNQNFNFQESGVISLTQEEELNVNGGVVIHPVAIAIGVACGIGVGVYEAGKAVGAFTYWCLN